MEKKILGFWAEIESVERLCDEDDDAYKSVDALFQDLLKSREDVPWTEDLKIRYEDFTAGECLKKTYLRRILDGYAEDIEQAKKRRKIIDDTNVNVMMGGQIWSNPELVVEQPAVVEQRTSERPIDNEARTSERPIDNEAGWRKRMRRRASEAEPRTATASDFDLDNSAPKSGEDTNQDAPLLEPEPEALNASTQKPRKAETARQRKQSKLVNQWARLQEDEKVEEENPKSPKRSEASAITVEGDKNPNRTPIAGDWRMKVVKLQAERGEIPASFSSSPVEGAEIMSITDD